MKQWEILEGDALAVLRTLEAGSMDAVVTDPPYPEIDRDYGRLTEAQWHTLMDALIPEIRRALKPQGSAMFILQPNSERVGRMRPWLWEFMAKWCREWGMVQDAYWWNFSTPPTIHSHRTVGLLRPSLKTAVWLGSHDCYRDQSSVLLDAAEATLGDKRINRHDLHRSPSGQSVRFGRALAACHDRGGVTPFNVQVMGNNDSRNSSGSDGHGAGTPLPLCQWWVKYICPPGGTILDPFNGAGTVGVAAVSLGRKYVGIEQHAEYCDISRNRLAAEDGRYPLFNDQPATLPRLPDLPGQATLFGEEAT